MLRGWNIIISQSAGVKFWNIAVCFPHPGASAGHVCRIVQPATPHMKNARFVSYPNLHKQIWKAGAWCYLKNWYCLASANDERSTFLNARWNAVAFGTGVCVTENRKIFVPATQMLCANLDMKQTGGFHTVGGWSYGLEVSGWWYGSTNTSGRCASMRNMRGDVFDFYIIDLKELIFHPL